MGLTPPLGLPFLIFSINFAFYTLLIVFYMAVMMDYAEEAVLYNKKTDGLFMVQWGRSCLWVSLGGEI
jgi:hypothetical protein